MLDQEKIVLASKVVELSETQTHLDLVDRVCFYDAANLNGVLLPSDGALEKAETLVNMPVVAKYRQNSDGLPDLGGHECYTDPVTGEVKFGTENIGTHTSVEIKDDVVEVGGVQKTLPCLFATYRIWTRNKNVTAAVKRLFSEGKLGNSWEILATAFTFENGIKTLTDYVFEGRALLGSGVTPAYGSNACSLSMASADSCEMMIAEALAADLTNKEENMKDKETVAPEIAEGTENPAVDTEVNTAAEGVTEPVEPAQAEAASAVEPAEPAQAEANPVNPAAEQADAAGNAEPEQHQAMLTDWDIRTKLEDAYEKQYDGYGWCSWLFPADGVAWMHTRDCKDETDILLVHFVVENDTVTITDATMTKLAVSIASVNDAISQRDVALAQANTKINALNEEIASLKPYKDAADQAEQARIEAETAEKRKEFKASMLSTKLFTEEEIETSEELKGMIESLNETAMKAEVAERFMRSIAETEKTAPAEHETASAAPVEKRNMGDEDTAQASSADYMRFLLG